MNEKRSNPQPPVSLMEELMQLTKSALYRCAQVLGVPQRSKMTKSELVDALSQKEEETQSVVKKIHTSGSSKNVESLKTLPSAVTPETRPKPRPKTQPVEAKPLPAGQIQPVKEAAAGPSSVTSSMPEPAPAEPELREPDTVWVGEEGPDLPQGYGVTVLRALPRDPFWAYLYWEISQETRKAIFAEEGEWYFDVSEPLVRVLNQAGDVVKEIPVLLDANCWYLNLKPNGAYEFELGMKNSAGQFRSLARSNKLTMPPMEPSNVTDEEWAAIGDEFQEILYNAAGVDRTVMAGLGGSQSMIPHILRHRFRIPWNWETGQPLSSKSVWPSSQAWPSSHILPSSQQSLK